MYRKSFCSEAGRENAKVVIDNIDLVEAKKLKFRLEGWGLTLCQLKLLDKIE
jgi:hypothetical protein